MKKYLAVFLLCALLAAGMLVPSLSRNECAAIIALGEQGKPYVLEINTIPGMTSASLFPKAAAAAGISYGQLCTRIAEVSLNQPRG